MCIVTIIKSHIYPHINALLKVRDVAEVSIDPMNLFYYYIIMGGERGMSLYIALVGCPGFDYIWCHFYHKSRFRHFE